MAHDDGAEDEDDLLATLGHLLSFAAGIFVWGGVIGLLVMGWRALFG